MSFQGTIVVQRKGQSVPDAFIKHVMKLCPTLVSVASVTGDKIEMDGLAGSHYTLANVREMCDLFKDHDLVLYFANYPAEFPEETAPPFILYEKMDGHPQLVLFTDGDFSNYAKEGSAHSPDFFAAQNYFAPKIGKWLEGKDNLTRVLSKLKDDDAVENIQNSFLNRGVVLFQSITGEIICIEKNNENHQLQADWGFASNSLGWKEEEQEEIKEEPKPVASKGRFRGGSVPTVNTEAANDKPAPKSDGNADKAKEKVTRSTVREPAPVPKPDPAPVEGGDQEEGEPTVRVVKDIPHHLNGKEPRKAWIRKELNTQDLPKNYKNMRQLDMVIPQSKLVEFLEKGWKHPNGINVVVERKNNRDNKNITPQHIPAPAAVSKPDDGFIPFSSDKKTAPPAAGVKNVEEQKALQAYFKTLDLGSTVLPLAPGNIHTLVAKSSSALEQAGVAGIRSLFGLSDKSVEYLATAHPEWFRSLFGQVLAALYKEWEASGKLVTKQAEPDKVEEEKQEVVDPPKNKSRFRKVA